MPEPVTMIKPNPEAAERLREKLNNPSRKSNSSNRQQQSSTQSTAYNPSTDQKSDQHPLDELGNRPPEYRPGKLEKKYNEFFTYQFGPIIVLLIWIATQDLEKASFYAPSPEECAGIAPHASRIVSRFSAWAKVPSQVHEIITSSDDTIALGYVVVGYLTRIGVMEKLGPMFMGMFLKGGNVVNKPDKQTSRSNVPIPTPTISPGNHSTNTGGIDLSSIPGLGGQWST